MDEYNNETYTVPDEACLDFNEKPLSNFVKNSFPDDDTLNNVTNVTNVTTFDLSSAIDPKQENIEQAKLFVDNALKSCFDNPAILGTCEFAKAYNILSSSPELKFEYRQKIKDAKPSGVPMADIDKMASQQTAGDDRQDSIATELIELAIDNGKLFYDEQADKAYISANIDGVEHTLAIGGKPFIDWLSYQYYSDSKADSGFGKSASESAIKQASFALSGIAKYEGEKERVYLRVADHSGGHYLFINDAYQQVIEVLPTGWRVIKNSPVKFWAPGSMQSLPIPQQQGDLSKLWDFVNIPEQDRLLVLGWLLEAMRAETPKPILALNGTQGTAKSSTQDKIRQLIDDNSVNLRAAPKSIEDVFVSAGCNWLASYENLSHITPAMQDAYCTLATGGGFAARTLYTNADETIIEVKRPVIINSIPRVITAQDLTDRSISIELPRIAYREEAEISAAWELAKPSIFGGLLDLFVKTLEIMPTVKLENPPRMADFTRLGEAMAQALGHPAGTFDTLYKANRAESVAIALEASPVAVTVRDMVDNFTGSSQIVFYDTVQNLYEKLSSDHKHNSEEGWPRSPKGLSEALKRQLPALQSIGIEIILSRKTERTANGRGITIKISKSGNVGNVGNIDLKESTPKEKNTNNSAAIVDEERF